MHSFICYLSHRTSLISNMAIFDSEDKVNPYADSGEESPYSSDSDIDLLQEDTNAAMCQLSDVRTPLRNEVRSFGVNSLFVVDDGLFDNATAFSCE